MSTHKPALHLTTLLLVALAACDASPLQPVADAPRPSRSAVERVVAESVIDVTGDAYPFSCSPDGEYLEDGGELIDMQGSYFVRIVEMGTVGALRHYQMHTMPIGLRGVGRESGEEFRVKQNEHAVANFTDVIGGGTYRQTRTLVGRDTGRSLRLVFAGQYRSRADGSLELLNERVVTECR